MDSQPVPQPQPEVTTDGPIGAHPVVFPPEPRYAAGGRPRTVPTGDPEAPHWIACPGCRAPLFRRHFLRGLSVCPECRHHAAVPAHERMTQLLDPGSGVVLDTLLPPDDPLGFVDRRPYPLRLAEARAETGLDEAVVFAVGTVAQRPLVLGCMDFAFLGGSLGTGAGDRIARAARLARARRLPFVVVTASGGARMQEGALSLMQMARTSHAMADLDEAGLLTVTVITDPTYGGVAASFATQSDVLLAEPGARMGFAGPRVIEQITGQRLPGGFQTAEFLLAHGLIDRVVPRSMLRPVLADLLAVAADRSVAPPRRRPAPSIRRPEEVPPRDPVEIVRLARHRGRPTTLDHVAYMLEDFQELHGDRMHGDCPAVVGGLGRLHDRPVVVVGHQKGHTTGELVARNFGRASPAGHRKAARLMRLAAKLGLPVVTLVDTQGADPGIDAEREGQALAVADNLRLMARLPVPIVAVVTGEGGSGGALALAMADRVLICANAFYSVISPEGCASILWRDCGQAGRAASALELDATRLLRRRVVDAVVPEPPGGAHRDPVAATTLIADAVHSALEELTAVPAAQLVAERRRRFNSYGTGS